MSHPQVQHPRELLGEAVGRHDRLLAWIASHVLASRLMADAALVLPLLVLPMSTGAKVTLGVLSGSWIQWWALPLLQRTQNEADVMRQAKADADHQALTHIAETVDKIAETGGGDGEGSRLRARRVPGRPRRARHDP